MPFKNLLFAAVIAILGMVFMAALPKGDLPSPPGPTAVSTDYSFLETRCNASDTVCQSRLVAIEYDTATRVFTVKPDDGPAYTIQVTGDKTAKVSGKQVTIAKTAHAYLVIKAPDYTTAFIYLDNCGASAGGNSRGSGTVVMTKKIYVAATPTTIYHSSGGLPFIPNRVA